MTAIEDAHQKAADAAEANLIHMADLLTLKPSADANDAILDRLDWVVQRNCQNDAVLHAWTRFFDALKAYEVQTTQDYGGLNPESFPPDALGPWPVSREERQNILADLAYDASKECA